MKFPKLIGNLTPSASVGASKVNSLKNAGSPFLTSAGPGFTARVKGEFSEVSVADDAAPTPPYLWFMYLYPVPPASSETEAMPSWAAKFVVVDSKKTKLPGKSVAADPLRSTDFLYSLDGLHVGAGRIAVIRSGVEGGLTVHSATLLKLTQATESAAGTDVKGALTFPSTDQLVRSTFATGWDTVRKTWSWGYMCKPVATMGTRTYPRTGRLSSYMARPWVPSPLTAFIGGTDGRALTRVDLPHEADDRYHFCSGVYVAGPGRLIGFVTVLEKWVVAPDVDTPGLPPGQVFARTQLPALVYVILSTDHGRTWTRINADFVLSYAPPRTTSDGMVPEVDSRPNSALIEMGRKSFFSYLGGGVSLFFLIGGVDLVSGGYVARAPMCFRTDGYTFTVVTAAPITGGPARARTYTSPELSLPAEANPLADGLVLTSDTLFVRPGSICFGPGCAAIFPPGGNVVVTRDAGITWTQLTTPFTLFSGSANAVYELTALVVKPYISADAPGKIVLVVPRADFTGADYFSTDGNFAAYRKIGPVVNTLLDSATDSAGVYLDPLHRLYPELPHEFKKATP